MSLLESSGLCRSAFMVCPKLVSVAPGDEHNAVPRSHAVDFIKMHVQVFAPERMPFVGIVENFTIIRLKNFGNPLRILSILTSK